MSESPAPHPLDDSPEIVDSSRQRWAQKLDYTQDPDRWQTVANGLRSIAIAQTLLLAAGMMTAGLSGAMYAWDAIRGEPPQQSGSTYTYAYGNGGYGSSNTYPSSRQLDLGSVMSCGVLVLLLTAAPVALGFLIRGLVLCLMGAPTRDLRKLLVIATVFLGLGGLTVLVSIVVLAIDIPEWFLGLMGAAFLGGTIAQISYLVFLGKVQRSKGLARTAIACCLVSLVILVVGQNMVFGQFTLSRAEIGYQLMLVTLLAGIMMFVELTCASIAAWVGAAQIQKQVAGHRQTHLTADERDPDLRRYF